MAEKRGFAPRRASKPRQRLFFVNPSRVARAQPEKVPHASQEALERYLGDKLGRNDFLETVLKAAGSAVVVTNPRAEDNPIVFVTQGFEHLTGYAENEVLGRNCRFLQGDDRDQEAAAELRRGVAAAQSVRVTLRNYRKDGSLFWNELYVVPVLGADGRPELFTGVQVDVTELHELEQDLRAAEARERHLAELRRLERLSAGSSTDFDPDPDRTDLAALSGRAPDLADRFEAQYRHLLEAALENRAYHVGNDVSAQLRSLTT